MSRTPLAALPRKILGPLCWVAVFSFFLNLIFLASPLYMMQVYDRVMRSQSVPTLLSLTAIVALCYAVFAILDGVRGQVLAGVSDRVEEVLSPALMRAAMRPAAPGVARADAQHLGRDLDTVRQWVAGAGALAFVDLPWAPLYLCAIALLHWTMGLFALGSVVLLACLSLAAERVARRPMARAAHAAAHAHAFGEAVLRQADCASTMALSEGLAAAWRSRRRAMLDGQMRASRSAILLGAVARFARMLLQSAILGLGAWLAIRHEVSAGAIFAGSLLLGRALAPVEAMLAGWRGTLAAHGAWRRLSPFLSRPGDEMAVALPPPVGELILEEVSYLPAGAQRRAVDKISLRLGAGACLAVIGASAAGKSTLARLVAGAIRPDAGIVRLDGADLCTWQPAQLGAAIGYLPQEVALFPGTVRDNIARFTDIADAEVVRAAQAAGAHEMILGLPDGYQTRLDAAAGALSGGQRQRVALARALLGDPALVILDEPNANLDAEGEAALIACVGALRARRRTVLLITHRSALVRLADHVAVLAAGRLDRVEPTASFLAPRVGVVSAAALPPPIAPQEAQA